MTWVALTNENETDGVSRLRERLRGIGITNRIDTQRGVRTLLVASADLARARSVLQAFVTDSDLLAMGEI